MADKINRKQFFDTYARQNGFDPLVPENWYARLSKANPAPVKVIFCQCVPSKQIVAGFECSSGPLWRGRSESTAGRLPRHSARQEEVNEEAKCIACLSCTYVIYVEHHCTLCNIFIYYAISYNY